MIYIQLEIDCGELMCGECEHLTVFSTGIGEYHPKCDIFSHTGKWGMRDMTRAKECFAAQKRAKERA